MKRMVTLGAGLLVLALIGSPLVMGGQMPMGGQGGQQEQPSGQQPMMGRGMMGMMCPMMGGQMDKPRQHLKGCEIGLPEGGCLCIEIEVHGLPSDT